MAPEKPDNTKQKIAASLVALVVIMLLAGGAVYGSSHNAAITTQTSTSALPAQAGSSNASSSTSNYKDGTYTASSDYYVPHGSENIKVTVTVKNGTVTDSSIENSENNGESAQYQEQFAYEYKTYVVGKPISNLQLDYVAGASDTTQGFNDALETIRTDAQAG